MDDMAEHVPVVVIRVSHPAYRDNQSHITFKISTYDSSQPSEHEDGSSSDKASHVCSLYPGAGKLLTTTYRRYSDFVSQYELLVAQFPGCLVPPLPEKVFHLTSGLTDVELEERTEGLHLFMARVALHPVLAMSAALQDFIYSSDSDVMTRINKTHKPILASGEEVLWRCEASGQHELLVKHGYTCDLSDMGSYNAGYYYSTLVNLMALDGLHQHTEQNAPLKDVTRLSEVTDAKKSVWNMQSSHLEAIQHLLTDNRGNTHQVYGERELEQCRAFIEESHQKLTAQAQFVMHILKNMEEHDKTLSHLSSVYGQAAQTQAKHGEQTSSLALGVLSRAASMASNDKRNEKTKVGEYIKNILKDQLRWLKSVPNGLGIKEPLLMLSTQIKTTQSCRDKQLQAINSVRKERMDEPLVALPHDAIDDSDARVSVALRNVLEMEFISRRQKRYVEALTSQLLIEFARFRSDFAAETKRVVTTVAEWNQQWCVHREAVWKDALLVLEL